MFDFSWSAAWTVVWVTAVAAAVAIALTVALVRLYGLRSLAKFAPHDFVATVAMGSIIGATAARSVPLPLGVAALFGVFAVQGVISRMRRMGATTIVDNDPMILMAGDLVLWDNMDTGGVTADDLRSKLREANVVRLDQVRAVILEGTGDIAVLHAEPETSLDPVLLEDVVGVDEVDPPDTWRPEDRDTHPFARP